MSFDVYKNKKVFMTGHTGFKGSWLSEWLLDLGAELTGFSIDVPTSPAHFDTLGLAQRMTDIRGDVRDLPALREAIARAQPEVIFHLAAQPLVRASYDHPLETFQANVMGTANLLEVVRTQPSVKAVVIVTTDKCYENRNWEFGYRETDPLGGHDPYSASKAAAEIVTSSYARSFFSTENSARICSARAGNVIGGGDWAADRLVPDCMRAWSEKREVTVRNPSSIRPWQHVLEPLGAYLLLGQRLLEDPSGIRGEGFNFGPGADLDRTTLELVTELERNWSGARHIVSAQNDRAKKEAQTLRLSCDKAFSRLQWTPRLKFQETTRWTTDWYRTYADSPAAAAAVTREQIQRYQSLAIGS